MSDDDIFDKLIISNKIDFSYFYLAIYKLIVIDTKLNVLL